MTPPRTALSHYTADTVFYGQDNLVEDLIGKASFVDVFMKQTFGRTPSEAETQIVNAVLVALMEHGMTPSAIATRMVYSSSPENLQSGVAAGLLAVGSRFVGTMEQAGVLLERIVHAQDGRVEAKAIARDFRQRREAMPGFGHHLHKPDDPRAEALLGLARQLDLSGPITIALSVLAEEVDSAAGRHVTINATGAIAAILGDLRIPSSLMRGFAVLARTAGLISHIAEEQREPSGRFIWDLVDSSMTAEPRDES
ncbi:MAG: citryl-CoA lyase [Roseiarcus sp.]